MRTTKSMVPVIYRGKTEARVRRSGHWVPVRRMSVGEAAAILAKYGGDVVAAQAEGWLCRELPLPKGPVFNPVLA